MKYIAIVQAEIKVLKFIMAENQCNDNLYSFLLENEMTCICFTQSNLDMNPHTGNEKKG